MWLYIQTATDSSPFFPLTRAGNSQRKTTSSSTSAPQELGWSLADQHVPAAHSQKRDQKGMKFKVLPIRQPRLPMLEQCCDPRLTNPVRTRSCADCRYAVVNSNTYFLALPGNKAHTWTISATLSEPDSGPNPGNFISRSGDTPRVDRSAPCSRAGVRLWPRTKPVFKIHYRTCTTNTLMALPHEGLYAGFKRLFNNVIHSELFITHASSG